MGKNARRSLGKRARISAKWGPYAVSPAERMAQDGVSRTYPHHRVLLRSRNPLPEKCRAGTAVTRIISENCADCHQSSSAICDSVAISFESSRLATPSGTAKFGFDCEEIRPRVGTSKWS